MNLPDNGLQFLYARLAWGVVLAALTLCVAGRLGVADRTRMALLAAAAAGSQWLPGPWSPAYWLGLVFQSPSGLTTALSAVVLRAQWLGRTASRPLPPALAAGLAAAGGLLYLDATGWIALGVYSSGFGPVAAPVAALLVGVLCAAAIARGAAEIAAWAVLAAVSLFVALRLPTGNLWDAVIDPMLWGWSLVVCLSGWRGRRAWRPRLAGEAG